MAEPKYALRIERFQKYLQDAEKYLEKGKSNHAYCLFAEMILSYLEYKECDCLLKYAEFKQPFDAMVARLEL